MSMDMVFDSEMVELAGTGGRKEDIAIRLRRERLPFAYTVML